MGKKFVDLEKMSKKQQKAYHAKARGSWGNVVPVRRVEPNRKHLEMNCIRGSHGTRSFLDC